MIKKSTVCSGARFLCVSVIFVFFFVAEVKSHRWLTLPRGYSALPRFSAPQSFPAQQTSPRIELVPGTFDQLNPLEPHWVCTNSKTGDMMIIGTENGKIGGTPNVGYPQQNQHFPPGAGGVPVPGGQNIAGQWPQQPQFNPQQPQYYPQQSVPQNPQQQGPQYNPQQQGPQYNPQQQGPQYNPQQPLPQNPQQQDPQNPQQHGPQYNPQQPLPQNPQQQGPQYNPQQPLPQNPSETTQPQHPKNPGFVEAPWTVLPGNTPRPSPIPTPTTTTEDPYKKFDNFDWSKYVNEDSSKTTMQTQFNGDGIIEPRMQFLR